MVADGDSVELSNLNRQHFFKKDLFRPKAFAMTENAISQSLLGCEAIANHVDFDHESAELLSEGVDIAYVGVDNDQTRAFASRFFKQRQIPVIFSGVNDAANFGYVFIQRPHGACLGCVFPEAMRRAEVEPRSCRSTPAAVDILQAMGAFVLYAVDSVLMNRECSWNFRNLNLMGGDSTCAFATQTPNCPLCGNS